MALSLEYRNKLLVANDSADKCLLPKPKDPSSIPCGGRKKPDSRKLFFAPQHTVWHVYVHMRILRNKYNKNSFKRVIVLTCLMSPKIYNKPLKGSKMYDFCLGRSVPIKHTVIT